jgi:hypothetical protein
MEDNIDSSISTTVEIENILLFFIRIEWAFLIDVFIVF